MTDDSHVAGHVFADPADGADYWTPERMAAARPREMTLEEDGTRHDQRPETTESDADGTEP